MIHSPKLTNHQVKIQHLDQTITVAKYPKEAGTSEKWPQGTDLCHTLMGALWKIAHIFLVGSREGLVLDILQVLSGISGVHPFT